MLPDAFDGVGVPAHETLAKVDKGSLDSFSMAFECGFSPADNTVRCLHTNEEPSGEDPEYLRSPAG
jgi:hypothetical protein